MALRIFSRSFVASVVALVIGSSVVLTAFADSGDTVQTLPSGTSSLTVEQRTTNEMYGKWSLLEQGGLAREGLLKEETAKNLAAGSYTLIVDPPEGAIATLRLHRNTELIKSVERPQMSFTISEGENLRMVIQHFFTRVGTVSVETDPGGIAFTLWGPNEQKIQDVTPASYLSMPEGQYKVQFESLSGCVKPAPMSLYLSKDKRVSFSLKLVCDEANRMREDQNAPGDERFVTVAIDGRTVVFEDVPQEAWFAPYVFDAVRKNILSGYRDAEGNPTGRFGPGNNVTTAELAKMAHTLMSIVAPPNAAPENERARDQWFSPYIASAEELGWTIYSDATVDPLREATRGEVLVTLLQTMDRPMRWQTGNVFKDVSLRSPYAAAIETAADLELVSGKQDATGQDTGLFGPLDPINRAEMAKILDLAVELKLAEE